MKKYVKSGKTYYSVGDAAKLLQTSAPKIRELMGNGILEWTQTRVNGRLVVEAQSILRHRQRKIEHRNSKP
jgi:hypothetical protein